MSRLSCVFLFVLLCNPGTKLLSQNEIKADSIKNILKHSRNADIQYNLLLKLATYDLPKEGLIYANEALMLSEKSKNPDDKAFALEHISTCYRKLGNYTKAIESSLQALKIYDSLGMGQKTASLQLLIGSHFGSEKNYTESSRYLNLALNTFRQNKDSINIALTLVNLGETYRLINNFDSSLFCLNEALLFNKQLSSDLIQGYSLGNRGLLYSQQKEINKAKQELSEAVKILIRLGDLYSVSVYQAELGKIFIAEGMVYEGEKLLTSSLEMAEKERLKEQICDISKDLAAFYECQNKFEKALNYQKRYKTYHDSLINIDNVRRVEQLHSSYWLEKKEANIQLLEIENTNKQKQIILFSGSALLFLTLTILLYRLNKQRRKAFNRVSEQNIVIEKREHEKALLLKELNHRVKNNLQMVASLFHIQSARLKGGSEANVLKAAQQRIDTLILLHQKLYSDDIDMLVSLDNYIRELVENLIYSSGIKVDLNLNLSPVRLHIDSAIPMGLIINELVTNSLKYAIAPKKALQLSINLQKKEHLLKLSIADNGENKTEDWQAGKSKSLGINLVYSLTKQLKGIISHNINNGWMWNISFDLNKINPDKHG